MDCLTSSFLTFIIRSVSRLKNLRSMACCARIRLVFKGFMEIRRPTGDNVIN